MNDDARGTPDEQQPPVGRARRVPHIQQESDVECAAACLAMVLAAYRRWEPKSAVTEACGVSRDGATALDIVRAARSYGLEANGYMGGLERIRQAALPVVAWMRSSHWVVVTRIDGRGVHLDDPAMGPVIVPTEQFTAEFSRVFLTMAPGPNFRTGGRPFRASVVLARQLRHSRSGAILAVLAGLIAVAVGALVAPLGQVFVDTYLSTGWDGAVASVVVGLVAVALIAGGMTWLQFGVLSRLQPKLGLVGSTRYVDRLLRAPMEFFGMRPPGDLAHRADYAVQVAVLVASQVSATAIACLGLTLYAALLLWYQWGIGLAVIVLSGLNIVVLRAVLLRRRAAEDVVVQRQKRLRGVLTQVLRAIDTVKATGAEQQASRLLSTRQADVLIADARMVGWTSWLEATPVVTTSLSATVVLVAGGLLVMDGTLSLGQLLGMQVLVAGIAAPLSTITGAAGQVQTIHGALASLQDVVDQPDAVTSGVGAGSAEVIGHLRLDNVTFGYESTRGPLLHGITIDIPPGRWVGVVGATGTGKSTVANLAAGLIKPWTGGVTLDGRPLADFDRTCLGLVLAKVDQQVVLFSGTVRDNVTLFDDSLSAPEVTAALADAQLTEDVAARAGGMDSGILDDGRDFSGGQRQRIDIARALAGDPKVLILDEASSALDSATEAALHAALRARGVSALVVAHRLGTVRDADLIVVLGPEGTIVEQGTHEQLIALRGEYFRLAADESGTALVADASEARGGVAMHGALGRNSRVVVEGGQVASESETVPARELAVVAADRVVERQAFDRVVCAVDGRLGVSGADSDERGAAAGMRLVGRAVSHRRRALLLVVAAAATVALLGLLTPVLMQVVLNSLVPATDASTVLFVGACLAVAALGAGLLVMVQVRSLARVSLPAVMEAQDTVWERLPRLPSTMFRQYEQGDLAVRLMAPNWLHSALDARTIGAGLAALFSLVNVAFIFVLDRWLAMGAVAVTVVCFAATGLAFRGVERLSCDVLVAHRSSEAWLLQLVQAVAKVRVAGAMGRMSSLYLSRLSAQAAANAGITRILGRLTAFLACASAGAAAIFATIAWLAARNGGDVVSPSVYLVATAAFSATLGALSGLAAVTLPLASARPVAGLLEPIMSTPAEATTGIDPGVLSGAVVLRDVDFAYPGSSVPVLQGVTIAIEPGEFVAIVGRSGSGKTTLARVILGLETPHAGAVLFDGVEAGELDPVALRRQLGAVLQDGQVLHGTILDTIRGGTQATEADAWNAAERAAVAEDIRAMPMGMQTVIDPSSISGGQAQRFLLARLFVGHPRIVVADEATSALDNSTQSKVMASLADIGATRIVVAHRLSTVRTAHRILVLAGGRIVEQGTYEALANAGGEFARLVAGDRS